MTLEGGTEEGEREGENHQCEIETSVSCLLHMLWPGTAPETQACALSRNRPQGPLVCRMMPNQWSHTSYSWFGIFKIKLNICLLQDLVFVFWGIHSFQEKWKKYPHRDLTTDARNTIIHSSCNLESIQLPINRWMDGFSCTMSQYFTIKRSKLLRYATTMSIISQ